MTRRFTILFALLVAVAPAAARGQGANSAARTFTLRNGLRVSLLHTGAERKAYVSLVLGTGEVDEPAFGPGLASLTADMLLQGSVARSAAQIVTESAALGTQLVARAGPMTTSISGDVATPRIPRLLSLVADLVRHPLLDTASFRRVQRHALAALDSALRNPADLAEQQWRAIVFPDSPFGRPFPYAATFGQLQLGHVRNVYDDNYSASRTHLYVSGVFDDAATERAVREIFGDWSPGLPPKQRSFRPAAVHEIVTVDLPRRERSVTWIGLPTIDPADPDFASLEVADALLAGGDSSRMAVDIASMEHLKPRGSSSLWQRKGATYWVDVLDVQAANTGAALRALFGEIGALKSELPSADELARAKQHVLAAFQARNNCRDGLVAQMELMDELSLADSWRAGYAKRVMAVTAEDVRRAVAAHLDPKRMAAAIVGDRASIEPQLADLRPILP